MTDSRLPSRARPQPRATALLLACFLFPGCNSDRSGRDDPVPGTTTQPELVRVEYGRLVDVYGLENGLITRYRDDVLVAAGIEDERPSTSEAGDGEITYDFFGTDPDTLQPRLLITRPLGSEAFRSAFDALDDGLRSVTPMRFGQAGRGTPFSVVPRNAALRLTFSAPLGVGDDFFVERDGGGRVVGLRNTEAVQLLSIVREPGQPEAFVPLPVRVIARERALVLDPVLLGGEGVQYQTVNNAAGLPESPDSFGANIRIALPLEGPLAIPGLRESDTNGITGVDNADRRAVVRDFRSGNRGDTSADLNNGFVRDPLPLRVVGELPMYLEQVDDVDDATQLVTVYKNGLVHEIDRGDVLRFVAVGGDLLGRGEVVADPLDDRDAPAVQHVRVRIRRVEGLAANDPRNLPGYPAEPSLREPWLVQNAPRAICVAEFTAGGADPRDDAANFLRFTPAPLPLGGQTPAPTEFVSPFAAAVVRFTKPVDLDTVKWADTFFFAMRDLTDEDRAELFRQQRNIDPAAFDLAKYRTPYLIAAQVFDEDGSQTALRLQPTVGFYLDQRMRQPPPGADYRYWLHLISDSADGGVRDLAGNPLDLQGTTARRGSAVVIPFTVDTRTSGGEPLFPDNIVASVVRRFASRDEDGNPSWFRDDEVQPPDTPPRAAAYPLEDLFGGFLYVDGRLQARPSTRVRVIADDLNQSPVVQQPPRALAQVPRAWCPQTVFDPSPIFELTDDQRASNSTTNLSAGPIQNPLNPFGCRLQTLWREVDLSLSRDDAFDFNLDVEAMYWAPFRSSTLQFDRFDRVSLWLGHSEYRPAPCVGDFSSLPSLPESGLRGDFERNFVWNPRPDAPDQVETRAPRGAAYVDAPLRIDPNEVVYEPNGINRFLPLPPFQEPYFVWRDERVVEQGGDAGLGSDLTTTPGGAVGQTFAPYVLSPFCMGQGRRWADQGGIAQFVPSYWNDARNFQLASPATRDRATGGLVGSVALPLLADFWTLLDSSELPAGGGFFASGVNGWQTALTVQSDPRPRFRVLSAGRSAAAPQGALAMGPSNPGWSNAVGGWGPNPLSPGGPWVVVPAPPLGGPDIKGDNTLYWTMLDLFRRRTVVTAGFVDLYDPHRVPEGFEDPRLGPFFLQNGEPTAPADVLPSFTWAFDPPLSRLPGGTSVAAQFRGASAVDPQPWYWSRWIDQVTQLWPAPTLQNPSLTLAARAQLRPTAINFPLDPFKAGDAHLRKWDTRPIPGTAQARNWWTYLYNRTVTGYVEDPNELFDPAYTIGFAKPGESFAPRDVRYVNWRFLMGNNTDASPPVAPAIDTFALSYRFQAR